mmetsp:Transcript_54462/g.176193  ORF Transcript_54462/g.176193 Transcript_54462/m.176193 type:complete len:835 (+) Transcript_54462:167-2671(+)
MQNHWFFKDIDHPVIYQCVPNFGIVDFDEWTGVPEPTGIIDVHSTMKSLELLASTKQAEQEGDFKEDWKRRHSTLTKDIVSWLDGAVQESPPYEACDIAVNVLDDGEGALMFRHLDETEDHSEEQHPHLHNVGFFVSSHTLSELNDKLYDTQTRNGGAFSAKIERLGKETIFVGLCATLPDANDDFVIGERECTAGFNCMTGEIVYNIGDGARILTDTWKLLKDAPVLNQTTASAKVIGQKKKGDTLRGHQVGEWFQLLDEPGFLTMFDSLKTPAGTPSSRSGSKILRLPESPAAGADGREGMPPRSGSPSKNSYNQGKPALEPCEGEGASRRIVPARNDSIVVKVERNVGQPWSIAFELHPHSESETGAGAQVIGVLSLGQFPPSALHPVVEFHPAAIMHHPSSTLKAVATVVSGVLHMNRHNESEQGSTGHGAASEKSPGEKPHQHHTSSLVSLSFTPEIVKYTETINEMFSTLFNTVTWEYHKMHEGGVISTWALAWLMDAADQARDLANHEAHATRIAFFLSDEKNSDELKRAMTGNLASSKNAEESTFNPFEPLVLEYLVIQAKCSKGSLYDGYRSSWPAAPFIRSLGYSRTRAKVECLYGYIECHERVMQHFSGIAGFPGLIFCLNKVLAAARRDLFHLQELNTRRFFYSKHALCLQIVLSKRLHKLEEQVEEGWISSVDAAGLIECTRDCMAKIGAHSPWIGQRSKDKVRVETNVSSFILGCPEVHVADAWEETFAGPAVIFGKDWHADEVEVGAEEEAEADGEGSRLTPDSAASSAMTEEEEGGRLRAKAAPPPPVDPIEVEEEPVLPGSISEKGKDQDDDPAEWV